MTTAPAPPAHRGLWHEVIGHPELVTTLALAAADAARIRLGGTGPSMTPIMGRRNVLIVEDADRLNDISGNALLKSLEEPCPRTLWILGPPTAEDVLPTIVSGTRQVRLRTPTTREVGQT